jgi:hypothetical protein
MERSESIAKLAMALAKAQAQMKGAVKDSQNPFFKSNYADLESVWDACRKPLTDNELSVIQIPSGGKDALSVVTVLLHSSGEFISGELLLNPKAYDPQGIGSAITYGRRYALAAFAGVYQTDDDAESAMARKAAPQSVQAPDGGIAPKCEDCGKAVIGYTGTNGPVTMGQAIAQSKDRFDGKMFCGGCQIKHGREKQNGKPKAEVPMNDPELVQAEDGEWWAQGTVTQVFHGPKAFSFKLGTIMFTCWHKTLVPHFVSALKKKVEFSYKVSPDGKFKNVERLTRVDGKQLDESAIDDTYIQEHEIANA